MLLSSEDTSGNDSKASASTSTQSLDSLAKAAAGKEIYRFIRRRSQGGFSSYGLTTVRQLNSGEKVEVKYSNYVSFVEVANWCTLLF